MRLRFVVGWVMGVGEAFFLGLVQQNVGGDRFNET